ncbi:MAG: hypothetical protein WKF35_09645 [Ferruginibacter sp.]
MKNLILVPARSFIQKITLIVASFFFSVYAFAQDKKVDVDITTKSDSGSGFFTQPWVWIVGGAVFLLLLVALLRNNSSKN